MTWIPWLAALAPLAHLFAAFAIGRRFSDNRTVLAAAWLSLGVAAAATIAALAAGAAASPTLGAAGLGVSVSVDALSSLLCSLIAFIGLVVVGYSRNYLAGDPGQARFMGQLSLTLGLLQALVLAGNVAQLVVCWIAANACVNRLLLFRPDRQAAVLAARKRFLVSRLADGALIIAALLLWRSAGSGDIGQVLAAARHGAGVEWACAAVLLALAAVFSAAQLPFHGWILEVMETPTPVSALLHAGVVNAGGFLVLRFADVVGAHPAALGVLTVVGAASAIFGSLVMLPQTSVKVALAYSTIAQMGFMLLECGLGAYSAAFLHIVAHALYKAHAFLTAGEAAAGSRRASAADPAPWRATLAAPTAIVIGIVIFSRMGVGPTQQPGVFVLWSVALLGLVRAWMLRPSRQGLMASAVTSVALIPAYAAGHLISSGLVGELWPRPMAPAAASVAISITVVAGMTALVCFQLRAPGLSGSAAWARVYALVSNGFHLNTFANRWVLRSWPAAPSRSNSSGAAA